MAARTTPAKVIAILGRNFDAVADTDLSRFIDTSSSLVDYVSDNDPDGLMTATRLEVVERWLAAHFYAHSDQLYQAKNTQSAGATFQGQTAMVLQSTQYGQTAMLLDLTNTLAKRNQEALTGYRRVATLQWLGSDEGAVTDAEY